MYLINRSWLQVQPYLDTLRAHADQEKNALGFLPYLAYEEAARQGKIFVATFDGHYAGHLFWGGTFPHARVVQLYVKAEHRGKDVAPLLLRQLETTLEDVGFLSIHANVASDLPANQFWQRCGFLLVRTKPGGTTRGRTINVRVKDLNTPHLFRRNLDVNQTELAIESQYPVVTPLYVLDLNVFWDVVRKRPRSEYARQAIAAALDNFIRVVVTTEFVNELKRTTERTALQDPALEFALELRALSPPPINEQGSIVSELGDLVFPNQARTGALSAQDQSDLLHLATAIHHGATGFITSERAIVNCGAEITSRFGLQVFHIKDFAEMLAARQLPASGIQVSFSGTTLRIWELVETSSEAISNFLNCVAPVHTAWNDINPQGLLTPHVRRVAVTSDKDIVCAASWDARAGLRPHSRVAILSDEEHPACEAALDAILNSIVTDLSAIRPVIIQLDIPSGAALARKAALLHGFRDGVTGTPPGLHKVCVGRPITKQNLSILASEIERCSGLFLPRELPPFTSYIQQVEVRDARGSEQRIELKMLEKLLSPTLLVLPERAGAIVPIRRAYADELFGTGYQLPLIPTTEAVLFSERIYLSSSRNLHTLPEGSILLFYESAKAGGRSAVIAAARAIESSVHEKRSLPAKLLRRGVIQEQELEHLTSSDKITVTRFDNVMVFTKPVSLSSLRALGCIDGSNLVTSRRISPEQVNAIMMEAYRL